MNRLNLINKNKISKRLMSFLALIIFISNLSQLPQFHGNKAMKLCLILLWILLFIYLIIKFNRYMKINIHEILILVGTFDIFIIICQLVTGYSYINSNFIYPLHLSLFIIIISYFIGQLINYEDIIKIINSYFISCLIVVVFIYLEYFKGVNWAQSTGYLYGAKNSIGQITLIGIILLITFPKSGFNKIFKWFAIIFFTLFLLMIKSRATLITFILAIFIIILFGIKNRKKQLTILIFSNIFIICCLTNENLNNFLVDQILLNNKNTLNLNTISSGRIDHIYIFLDNFNKNELIGNGGMYLESFPLSALISYGIIGGSILFSIAFSPLYFLIKYKRVSKFPELYISILTIYIIMITNGIFEELSPFGPGVKCYSLWMLIGLYIGICQQKKSM